MKKNTFAEFFMLSILSFLSNEDYPLELRLKLAEEVTNIVKEYDKYKIAK